MYRTHTADARWGAVAVVLCLVACQEGIHQPIAYNHQKHVKELEMDCDACHEGARTGAVAGMPGISVCSDCHMVAQGESAEEKKVVEAVEAEREIEWKRLYELERDVFFSHRRHVTSASIKCEHCHGDMANQERPPRAALVTLMMDDCMDCHQQHGADLGCIACHR
jgi:hypothetical protein